MGIDDVDRQGGAAGQGGAPAGGAGGKGPGPGGAGGSFSGGAGGTDGGPPGQCMPGQTRCAGGAIEQCGPGGRWAEKAACAVACDEAGAACVLPTQVVAGAAHACALLNDGSVRCWGGNDVGQLGNGLEGGSPRPTKVEGLAGAKRLVSNGRSTTCAILADDAAQCWGENGAQSIAEGAGPVRTPRPISASPFAIKHLALGARHACVVDGGDKILCRGDDALGQLGDGTAGDASGAFAPTAPTSGAPAALALGFAHSCALTAEGAVDCWGEGRKHQHGNPGAGIDILPKPGRVAGVEGALAVAAGGNFSCALLEGQTLSCWGENNFGQLGRGSASGDGGDPGPVPDLNGASSVALGATHACATRDDGSLFCWGDNAFGQLGADCVLLACPPIGGASYRPTPAKVQLDGVAVVAAGSGLTCALTVDFDLYCWGNNGQGQLGRPTLADSDPTPGLVIWR